MKSIRVVAVGLVLAAYLMSAYGVQFFHWWMADSVFSAFYSAVTAISPMLATIGGGQAVPSIMFVLLCLGAGLFVSAVVYSPLEDLVLNFVSTALYYVTNPLVWRKSTDSFKGQANCIEAPGLSAVTKTPAAK